MSILQAKSISKQFGSRTILDGLSFDIKSSEICAIIGKSGAGKTTLIRILSGHLLPDKGEVLFKGEPLEGPDVRLVPGYEEIRIVHQDFQLKHRMTVRENIRYELLAYEKDYQNERIETLLSLCKIEHLTDKDISLLSGGEKQRVAVARGMATEPEVLIMDEPFSNLDINTKSALLSELKSIAKTTGTAIIFITHDARDAMEVADRMIVLKEGKIVNDASPYQVYGNPQHPETANLLGVFNRLSGQSAENLIGANTRMNAVWFEGISLGQGNNEGRIESVIFCGGFNKVMISYQDEFFWAQDHTRSLEINDLVKFALRKESTFTLSD